MPIVMAQSVALPGSAPAGYTAQGVNFDGVDYMFGPGGTDMTGSADGKKGTVSFWFRINGGNGNYQILFETATQKGLNIFRDNANKWNLLCNSSTGGAVSNIITTATYVSGGGWHHLLSSWDADIGSSVSSIYIDDVSDTGTNGQDGTNPIDYATASTITIGGRLSGPSLQINMDIADLYINYVANLDLSVTANRRKFISAAHAPVDLGADGSTPTGTAPIGFFSSSVATWHQNKGSGGNIFTVDGTLTASSSNPP